MRNTKLSYAMNSLLKIQDFGPTLGAVGAQIHQNREELRNLICAITGETDEEKLESYLHHIIRSIDAASKMRHARSLGRRDIQRRIESIQKTAEKLSELLDEAHKMGWIKRRHFPDYTPIPEKVEYLASIDRSKIAFPSGATVPGARLLDESLLADLNPLWACSTLSRGLARSAEKQLQAFDDDFQKYPSKTRLDLEIIAFSIYLLWKFSNRKVKHKTHFPKEENSNTVCLYDLMCSLAGISESGDAKYHLREAEKNRGAVSFSEI